MSLILFAVFAFVSFLFGSLFSSIIPGGDGDLKWVMGVGVFIAGEIAACTYIIVNKVEKLKNKHMD